MKQHTIGQIIGQFVVTAIVLVTFYGFLSFKDDLGRCLFITTMVLSGFAGAAFLGIFAVYSIGAAVAIFFCTLAAANTEFAELTIPIAFIVVISSFFFSSHWEKKEQTVNKKVLFFTNMAQFITVLITVMTTILGK